MTDRDWQYALLGSLTTSLALLLHDWWETHRRRRLSPPPGARTQMMLRMGGRGDEGTPSWQEVRRYLEKYTEQRRRELGLSSPPPRSPRTWMSEDEIQRVGKLVNSMYRGCLHFWLARWCTSLVSWRTIAGTMTRTGMPPPRPRYYTSEGKVTGSSMHEYEQEI